MWGCRCLTFDNGEWNGELDWFNEREQAEQQGILHCAYAHYGQLRQYEIYEVREEKLLKVYESGIFNPAVDLADLPFLD